MYKSNNVNEGLKNSRTTKEKIKRFSLYHLPFILLASFFLVVGVKERQEKINYRKLEKIQQKKIDSLQAIKIVTPIEKKIDKSFTEENLIKYLNEINIKYVDVVLAQAKLESANYTSYLFRNNKNLFGMRRAGLRPTTTISTHKRYAVYDTWQQSVMDYALLQCSILPKVKNKKQYIAYIGKHYAELPQGEYERLLKPFIQE